LQEEKKTAKNPPGRAIWKRKERKGTTVRGKNQQQKERNLKGNSGKEEKWHKSIKE
jgi:hypothetical protein